MKLKNNLDEMQEQKLLQIEHTGFWLLYWGLFVAMTVQFIAAPGKNLCGGELAVFLPVSVWLAVKCLRAGIWDRRLQPKFKTNLLLSLLAGLAPGVTGAFLSFRRLGSPGVSLAVFGIAFVITAGLCLAVLSLSAAIYKKKVRSLEKEMEQEAGE